MHGQGGSTPPTDPASDNTAHTDFAIVSVGTFDYRVGSCCYRKITLSVGGQEITGMALYSRMYEVEELIIPDQVGGLPVIAIGTAPEYAQEMPFYNDKTLKRVVIPETVCLIGVRSFANCTELTDLALPSGIKCIGSWAFENCPGLKEITITADMKLYTFSLSGAGGLQKVTIQEGVTELHSFHGCENLTELTLPSSMEKLGLFGSDGNESSFYGTSITFLEIPEGVTYLGWYLFEGAPLESIILPSTLEETGDRAFNCEALKAVYFRGTEEQFIESLYDEIAATIYFLSETQPTQEGNYWHYVDGKPVIW